MTDVDPVKAEMVERAKAMLIRVAEARKNYAGECSSCKWSRLGVIERTCANPVVTTYAYEVTDAYEREAIKMCSEQRDKSSVFGEVFCGPNGLLYEPGLFARLWARVKS